MSADTFELLPGNQIRFVLAGEEYQLRAPTIAQFRDIVDDLTTVTSRNGQGPEGAAHLGESGEPADGEAAPDGNLVLAGWLRRVIEKLSGRGVVVDDASMP